MRIDNQLVLFLIPHTFQQYLPTDVDYRVMSTFLQFYLTLQKFVNFKLFHDKGMNYPPKMLINQQNEKAGITGQVKINKNAKKQKTDTDEDMEAANPTINAENNTGTKNIQIQQKIQKSVNSVLQSLSKDKMKQLAAAEDLAITAENEASTTINDTTEAEEDEFDQFHSKNGADSSSMINGEDNSDSESSKIKSLFKGFYFLIGREVPAEISELIIKSAGGQCILQNIYENLLYKKQQSERFSSANTAAIKKNKKSTKINIGKQKADERAAKFAASQDAEAEAEEVKEVNDLQNTDFSVLDQPITHYVVDRPLLPNTVGSSSVFTGKNALTGNRVSIQPQWLFDCFNTRTLLPSEYYAPGQKLPPHLSPFVDDEQQCYIPAQREVLAQWGAQATASQPKSVKNTTQLLQQKSSRTHSTASTDDETLEHDQSEQGEDEEEDSEYEQDLAKERAGVSYSAAKKKKEAQQNNSKRSVSNEENEYEDENDDSEDEDEEDLNEGDVSDEDESEEEEAPAAKGKKPILAAKRKLSVSEQAAEEKNLAKLMMNKKNARLYQRMQYGIQGRQAEVDKLQQKRQKIEAEEKKQAKKNKNN